MRMSGGTMASLLRSLFGKPGASAARFNETTPLGITDWAKMFRPGQQFTFNGVSQQGYQVGTGGSNGGAYSGNSVVFGCELRRLNVFSEARWQYQQLLNGRPGDLFGTPALSVFEEPWPGASTRDLLVRVELDAATSGNSYWVPDPVAAEAGDTYLMRLEPDNTKILTSAVVDPVSGFLIGEQLLGYAYWAGGDRQRQTFFAPDEIAHFKPIPDPGNQFIGMSWMNPCLPDIQADGVMTQHKLSTLSKGGQLGYVVSLDATVGAEEFQEFVADYRLDHEGPQNAGRTLFLGGGADVKTVGQSFVDLALKATQGAGETRIATCAGVPPVVAGLSEGMQGSSLNAGNYGAAKRNFVDGTMRPAWGAFAGAFASLIPRLSGARLWYDDRDIPFLREDILDQAEILQKDAITVRQLLDGGYEPDAVIDAVTAGDLGRLTGKHSGFLSVQLQEPGAAAGAAATPTKGSETP
jgi:hypothetical protein